VVGIEAVLEAEHGDDQAKTKQILGQRFHGSGDSGFRGTGPMIQNH
jgi:tRNA(Ile)-lysidine synthase TilS/MesJ